MVVAYRTPLVTVSSMILLLRLRLWQLHHRRLVNVVVVAMVVLNTGALTLIPRLAEASTFVARPAAHVTAERSATTHTSAPVPSATSVAPESGPLEVALIGDSLLVRRDDEYTTAFQRYDVAVRLDGAGSRSLRYGWLCTHQGRVVTLPEPSSPRCRRQGLELVRWWVATNQLGNELVVALGTNDAYRRTEDVQWSLSELRRMLGTHPLTLVGTSVFPMRQAFHNWNETAAQWCVEDLDCRFLDWAADPAGQDPHHFSRDGVHPSGPGVAARADFVARRL